MIIIKHCIISKSTYKKHAYLYYNVFTGRISYDGVTEERTTLICRDRCEQLLLVHNISSNYLVPRSREFNTILPIAKLLMLSYPPQKMKNCHHAFGCICLEVGTSRYECSI